MTASSATAKAKRALLIDLKLFSFNSLSSLKVLI